MKLKGKRVLVVGLGKTGEALCEFLLTRQAKVHVSEAKPSEHIAEKVRHWSQKGVTVESGGHRRSSFLQADLIVLSPGVPRIPELNDALAYGVEVLSEIEFAFRFLKGEIIGITGSNGKSTTATLTWQVLLKGGRKAFLAGNIGTPLISFVDTSKEDHTYITELSSFQLEFVSQFRVSIAVFLNMTPDHLDWHKSFNSYFAAKKRLFTLQTQKDTAILNQDDSLVWAARKEINSRIYSFSRIGEVIKGCFIDKNWIVCKDKHKERIMNIDDIPLRGVHNQENVMASLCVAHLHGIPIPEMRAAVKAFKGLEHRLEKVATLKGITFYNDSKATNVGATLKSILSFDQRIVLILGGRDKGGEFETLKEPIVHQVKKIILLGEAKEKIARALQNTVPLHSVSSMREAVESSFAAASSGDVILLAPACTSFDMFADFEERGKVFKQEVFTLKNKIVQRDLI